MSNIKSVKIDTKKTMSKKKMYQDILNSPSKIKEILTKKRNKFHSNYNNSNIPILPDVVRNRFQEPTPKAPTTLLDGVIGTTNISEATNIPEETNIPETNKVGDTNIIKEEPINNKSIEKLKKRVNKSRNLNSGKKRKSSRRVNNIDGNRTKKRHILKSKQRTRKNLSSQVIDKMFQKIITDQEVEIQKFKQTQKTMKLNQKQQLILKTLKFILKKDDQNLLEEYIKKMNRSQVEMILTKLNICHNKKTPLPLLKNILNNTISSNIRIIKNQ